MKTIQLKWSAKSGFERRGTGSYTRHTSSACFYLWQNTTPVGREALVKTTRRRESYSNDLRPIGGSLPSGMDRSPDWLDAHNPRRLGAIVADVAARLGETTGDIIRWSRQKANEAGLDLLCFRPFPDGRVGVPVYLIQCASGGDWHTKLKTPDLRIWTKVIDFAADPKKAFSMPFALSASDFTFHCNLVDGLLLDRYRLLAPGQAQREWITPQLTTELVAWARPRVAALPINEP